MSNLLSKGPTITVSTSELESKIDAAAGKFIKSLSKSQKALGMSIDTMGRYVNAQGKCVEGLTQAQIKLGQYVDEEGKVRTENKGFVADPGDACADDDCFKVWTMVERIAVNAPDRIGKNDLPEILASHEIVGPDPFDPGGNHKAPVRG